MKAFNWSTYHKEYRERNKEKLNERMRLYMQKKRSTEVKKGFIRCACCNAETKNAPNKLYCNDCKKLIKNILRKHKGDISLSVNFSDAMFTTDLCDQKCDVCKYENCILPEE